MPVDGGSTQRSPENTLPPASLLRSGVAGAVFVASDYPPAYVYAYIYIIKYVYVT